jgi:hypothetical protein
MSILTTLVTELESKLSHQTLLNEAVSKSSVGWHIEHTFLVIKSVTNALKSSTPNDYKWTFSPIRTFVLTTNHIPRGKGKAPKSVQPQTYSTESLLTHFEKVREKMTELYTLSPDTFFKHPYFGNLKHKNAIKFLEIHTKHHLKIIDDIVKA